MYFLYLDVISCVVGDAVVQQVKKMLFNIRKNRRLRRLLLHLGTSFGCPDFEILERFLSGDPANQVLVDCLAVPPCLAL